MLIVALGFTISMKCDYPWNLSHLSSNLSGRIRVILDGNDCIHSCIPPHNTILSDEGRGILTLSQGFILMLLTMRLYDRGYNQYQ